jgi:hypothetical protein
MNKKGKGKRRSLMVDDTLHARLKMIAAGRREELETMVSNALWNFAKRTPIVIPQAPKE